jgi:hypothetical protein
MTEVDRLDLVGRSHKQRRIGAVIHDGHVRARTLPDDPALDDLRTDWGEVEYVPAADLKGAVEDARELVRLGGLRDEKMTNADWQRWIELSLKYAETSVGGQ